MRIGIDARMIHNTGIGTYLQNLIRRIGQMGNNEIVLFGDPDKLKNNGFPVINCNAPIYGIKEQLLFPGLVRKANIDLFHAPHYAVPLLAPGKMVVTIYDIIHLIFPEYLSLMGKLYARIMYRAATSKALKIMTISEHTKNDLISRFKIEPSKIAVAYPGVSEEFTPALTKSKAISDRYGSYLLFVGALRPHKNIPRLIEAFELIRQNNKTGLKLLIIGDGKEPYKSKITTMISQRRLEKEVFILSGVSNNDLISYYQNASLFVFPSLYEGFGLPPLEAMACGCPVVSSNTSSLPEVAGDAAILFDPYNTDEIADAVTKVLTDETLKDTLIRKGLARSKIFSWDSTAAAIASVYEEAMR